MPSSQDRKVTKKDNTHPVASDENNLPPIHHEGEYVIKTFHQEIANAISDLAEVIQKELLERMKANKNEIRIPDVAELFKRFAKEGPQKSDHLETLLKDPNYIVPVATLDKKLSVSLLKAYGEFDKTIVTVEGKIKTAQNSWHIAVKEFNVASQYNGAVFQSKVTKAVSDGKQGKEHAENHKGSPCHNQIAHCKKALAISGGLEEYEKEMAKSTKDLVQNLNSMISILTDAWTSTTYSEALLIKSEQQALSAYWPNIEKSLMNEKQS